MRAMMLRTLSSKAPIKPTHRSGSTYLVLSLHQNQGLGLLFCSTKRLRKVTNQSRKSARQGFRLFGCLLTKYKNLPNTTSVLHFLMRDALWCPWLWIRLRFVDAISAHSMLAVILRSSQGFMRPIWLPPCSVNQIFPSRPAAIPKG